MDQQGAFVWYDLMTTDLKACMAFYEEVLGWTFVDSGMPGPTPYMLAQGSNIPLGGVMQLTEEMCGAGAQVGWMGHIHAPDVDATAEKLKTLGGAVLREPADIPGVGRFAVVTDPHGAVFSLFANAPEYPMRDPLPKGAPGQCGWNELHAGDLAAEWAFYEALFGWKKAVAVDMGPMGVYQTFTLAAEPSPDMDRAIGGMMTKMPESPGTFWMFYFNVESATAAAERTKAGGGQVVMGPHQVPGGGWIANCVDPQGGFFSVLSSVQ